MKFATATWTEITEVRAQLEARRPSSIEDAARHFTRTFSQAFETLVLARVFVVLPFEKLPAAERTIAEATAEGRGTLTAKTPILTLLGTSGTAPEWNDRSRSAGHRAIPLLDASFVQGAPMIAKLLADLDVDLSALGDAALGKTLPMLGAGNGKFFVDDAVTAVDALGRHVIANREFVRDHGVRTVFGMGGSYYDGSLVVAVCFTTEQLDASVTDRFASFVSTFKTQTTRLQQSGSIFD